MTILLFNDNPVVQKLVALSAQKTKDDLTIASSLDEVQESGYDLLIIDDALYSDDIFAALKGSITYKSALYMATRGNVVPAGFDNIINKPFLPTDLVETLILIEKNISSSASGAKGPGKETGMFEENDAYAINLQETLSAMEHNADQAFLEHDIDDMGDDFGLGELEGFDEELPKTAVLDQDEVQEVQGLLEDAESDALIEDDEITVKGIDDFGIPEKLSAASEEEFDFDGLIDTDEENSAAENALDLDTLNIDEEMDTVDFEKAFEEEAKDEPAAFEDEMLPEDLAGFETSPVQEKTIEDDDFDFGDAMADIASGPKEEEADEETFDFDADMAALATLAEDEREEKQSDDLMLDEDAFGELEFQIQEAVGELEPEELDMELDAGTLEDFELGSAEEDFQADGIDTASLGEGFDEFDMLDERELKLAIGEEVEDFDDADDIDIRVGESDYASLGAEALAEAAGQPVSLQTAVSEEKTQTAGTDHTEGVEALQALLKALANEDVAKSLKGLNISININFGNDK